MSISAQIYRNTEIQTGNKRKKKDIQEADNPYIKENCTDLLEFLCKSAFANKLTVTNIRTK